MECRLITELLNDHGYTDITHSHVYHWKIYYDGRQHSDRIYFYCGNSHYWIYAPSKGCTPPWMRSLCVDRLGPNARDEILAAVADFRKQMLAEKKTHC